ncbi:doublecortin domain-containing protein 2C [Denticeps clupeoides]|uniref:doublecortin domain-containing protein 2C n=1 Tax=Denticeps clupeoides TaxID=299321 RepID=UPI0010A2B4C1|nr:doublecortin domain-containing protein 2C [Denticeps clupeoides]
MTAPPGRALPPQPAPPKTVVVYRNGDVFYPGRKFVINQRTATFESFLGNVTSVIEAPFGAVRNLYTSREGHRILDLDQLEHGESYVAAGRERFKQLDYHLISTKKPERKKSELIQPVAHSRIVVSARWKNIVIESCTINVFTNGGSLVPPARIMIPKYTLRSWENVLAMVTEKVRLRTGAVQRLCRLDGTIVLNAGELENNQYYVAVGAEKFRWLPYFPWVPNKASTRDHSNGEFPAVLERGRLGKDGRSDWKALHHGSEQDGKGGKLLKTHTDSRFHAKAGRAKHQKQVSKVSDLLSSGEGSVFKAKDRRRETAGAAEVQDAGGLKVDLPIDQVRAETVEDELPYSLYPQSSSSLHPASITPRPPSSGGGEVGAFSLHIVNTQQCTCTTLIKCSAFFFAVLSQHFPKRGRESVAPSTIGVMDKTSHLYTWGRSDHSRVIIPPGPCWTEIHLTIFSVLGRRQNITSQASLLLKNNLESIQSLKCEVGTAAVPLLAGCSIVFSPTQEPLTHL